MPNLRFKFSVSRQGKVNLAAILPLKSKLSGNFSVSVLFMEVSKWLNFQKFQLKWEKLKHFKRPKQRPALRKLFGPPLDKSLLRLWNNIFSRRYTGIYWHLLFKFFDNIVPGLLEMVQCKCFYWHQPETCLLENL